MDLSSGTAPTVSILPSNTHLSDWATHEPGDEPDSLPDTIFAAGLLGILVVVITMVNSELPGRLPDWKFWQALPLLLVLPPAALLGALFAPGGVLGHDWPGWTKASALITCGLLAYSAVLALVILTAALAQAR